MSDLVTRSQPSIRTSLLRLIIGFCLMLTFTGAMGVLFVSSIRAELDNFRQQVTPIVDAVPAMELRMSQAQAAYRGWVINRDPDLLAQYRAAKADAIGIRERMQTLSVGLIEPGRFSAVATAQNEWFRIVDDAEARGIPDPRTTLARSRTQFQEVTATLDRLDASVAGFRVERRDQYNRIIDDAEIAVIAIAATATVAALLWGWRLWRRITEPLREVRDVALRQAGGDLSVRADETTGPGEVAEMARALNRLTANQQSMLEGQRRDTTLHQSTGTQAQLIGAAGEGAIDWDAACREIGAAVGCAAVTVNEVVDEVDLRPIGFWSAPGTRIPFPDDLAEVTALAGRGIEANGGATTAFAADSDLGRALGGHTVIVAPIRLREAVLGGVTLWRVGDREWHASEIDACRRFADLAGRTLTERRYTEGLRELDRQKSAFVATTSHELRTPLTSISGYLEMVVDGDYGALSGEQRQVLEVVERNVARLRKLIEDLLILNRFDSGRGITYIEDLALCRKVTRVCEILLPTANRADVRLRVDCPEAVQITGDRDQIERALTNVIGNAIKFSRRGGEVVISCRVEGDRVVVRVSDEGMGIPAGDLDRLFTRFFRASNALDGHVPGTGLGLSIVKAIAEGHGGSVTLESVEGEGTTVTLVLPRAGTSGALEPSEHKVIGSGPRTS